MNRINPITLAGFLVALIVVLGGVALLKGGMLISRYEGDALHLMQIVQRIELGQWPHLDFQTPIGGLAFWPITLFAGEGTGLGQALVRAQVLIAVLLAPMVWRAGSSRLGTGAAALFALTVMALTLGMVHGEADPVITVSMHYNRWAWAYAYVAVVLAVLPTEPGDEARWLDGALIGILMGALALTKATYFAALAPGMLVAVIGSLGRRGLASAMAGGVAVAALMTVLGGVDYWQAYLHDLMVVAGSETRTAPGKTLSRVISEPSYILGSLMAFVGVILLRQARISVQGLVLMLLVPGFFYITYQNFGNDPQWLVLLAVLLLALRPTGEMRNGLGWNIANAIRTVVVVVLAIATPSLMNMTVSPFRMMARDTTEYVPAVADLPLSRDFLVPRYRDRRVDGQIALEDQVPMLRGIVEREEDEAPISFNGALMPRCEALVGNGAYYKAIRDDLVAAGITEGKIFEADLLPGLWLYGPWGPLEGGAPWHYEGLPGIGDAAYLLVPTCPTVTQNWRLILRDVEAANLPLTEVRRTGLYILYDLRS